MEEVFIRYCGRKYAVREGESVLEALERGGERVASSCRAGVCQSCLVKGSPNQIPPSAQNGLKLSQKQEGYFLACLCKPQHSMSVSPPGEELARQTEVILQSVERRSENVACLSFAAPPEFKFRAGQFLSFTRPDGLCRSYSISSLPNDTGEFQIHVRRLPEGRMSNWFYSTAQSGERLLVSNPRGECCYQADCTDKPLVLAGTGTGVAPLWALARDALARNHAQPIFLFDGALSPSALYLREEIENAAVAYPNFQYLPCALRAGESSDPKLQVGELGAIILAHLPTFLPARFFLCGDPHLVSTLKKKLFLGGVALREIFADPFVAAAARPQSVPLQSEPATVI